MTDYPDKGHIDSLLWHDPYMDMLNMDTIHDPYLAFCLQPTQKMLRFS